MIIYKVTNRVNGKVYVGQTSRSLSVRWQAHVSASRQIRATAFQKEIAEFGANNFLPEVIEHCQSKENLLCREVFWIKELNTLSPNGYNGNTGGYIGNKMSEVVKQGIIKNIVIVKPKKEKEVTKKYQPWAIGENNVMFGKNHTDNSRRKMSKTRSESKMYVGENNPRAILSMQKANEIRLKYKPHFYTLQMLATEYGVCLNQIAKVIKNKIWVDA